MKTVVDYGVVFILILLFLFMFGQHSISKFFEEDTFNVEKRVQYNEENAPAVTICTQMKGNGWKQNVPRQDYFHEFERICNSTNITSAYKCMLESTFSINETVANTGIDGENEFPLDLWATDIPLLTVGQCHTTQTYNKLGDNRAQMMYVQLSQAEATYRIFIHDPKLSILNLNPETFPEAQISLNPKDGLSLHYIKPTAHMSLSTKRKPCEESPEYSFRVCVRSSLSRVADCRLPWDDWADKDLAPCDTIDKILKINKKFHEVLYMSREMLVQQTGCRYTLCGAV